MQRKLLFLTQIWPEPKASAAHQRTMSLIEAFLDAGYAVTVSADSRETESTERLRERGCQCVRHAPNDSSFDAWVAALQPDLTIFDRFTTEEKFSWRVRNAYPASLRVLDTIDLHFLRGGREAAVKAGRSAEGNITWPELCRWAGDLLLRELAAIYRSDLSLLVSDYELALLRDTCSVPKELLQLCRLIYPSAQATVRRPLFSERRGFTMVGTFRHPPNEDALVYLKAQIWPGIKARLPQAELKVWGSHALPRHLVLSGPGLSVEGFLPDVASGLAAARVNLAPLRYGAGIKGKVADGWAQGTPAVASPVAAEGMHENRPFGGLIAEGPEAFIEAAVRLHEDEGAWTKASEQGLALLQELYQPQQNTGLLLERIEKLWVEREESRARNLFGAIVWQQGMRSTEYFSRWLEVKNRVKFLSETTSK